MGDIKQQLSAVRNDVTNLHIKFDTLEKKSTLSSDDLKKQMSAVSIRIDSIGSLIQSHSIVQGSRGFSKPLDFPSNILCETYEQLQEFDKLLSIEEDTKSVYFVSF